VWGKATVSNERLPLARVAPFQQKNDDSLMLGESSEFRRLRRAVEKAASA
jgi:hypothetical protein